MKARVYLPFLGLALIGSATRAQEPPSPPPPPPPQPPGAEAPGQPRPPGPPQEGRERPPFDPRGPGDRPDRPPFPPRDGQRPGGSGDRDRDRDRDHGPDGPDRRGRDRDSSQGQMERERPMKPSPYIGVVTSNAPAALSAQLGLKEGFGLLIENVLPESPAQTAGVQRFDVLTKFNDQELAEPSQLSALVRAAGKDADVALTLRRKGQEQKVTLKIGEKMLPVRQSMDPREMLRGEDGRGGMSPEFRERMEQYRRNQESQGPSRTPNISREFQERLKGTQQRLNEYQEALRKWQDEIRTWQEKHEGEMPKPPPIPKLDLQAPPNTGGPVRPTDILREMRPGGEKPMRGEWSEGSSRWDASRARATIRDHDGEVELSLNDGHRTLTARNPGGDTVFSGPVDSPEQREAVPEPFRGKLKQLEVPPPPPSRRGPDDGAGQPRPRHEGDGLRLSSPGDGPTIQ